MKVKSDGTHMHDLIGPSASVLAPIFSNSEVDSVLAATQGLSERFGAQLAMASIEPLGGSLSPVIAAVNASVAQALKPSIAMQSVMERIRPFTEIQARLLPISTFGADFRGRLAGLAQAGQIAKQLASVNPLLSTSALTETKSLRGILAVIEPLRGLSLPAAELAAIATANSFKNYPRMAELVSLGSPLLKAARFTEFEEIDWESPASSQLLSTIAAAAETLKEAPVSAPPLTDLPDASNDGDGGLTSTPQQLQGELADAVSTGDLSKLSPAAKAYFKWFCWFLGLLATYLAAQNAVREELCFLQPKILPGMTAGQMGKTVRRAMCTAAFIPDGDFRFLRGENVRFRAGPSTKAAILPFHLVDGQVLEVLDASNPDWLLVTVVAGGAEGWVSRKYTRVFTLN
ncbi:SH3 domain-containing protein [Pseudomonas alcaligenes]|uniref:SH3 domain-containing protein n=1 Tax=Aquipseudomonas alcaligenes TaxID=43263 RepID=UPI003590197D